MIRTLKMLAILLVLLPFANTAEAQLAPADAGAFMGSWTLTLDSPQGALEQSLVLKEEGGKVIGEMTSAMQPETQKVTDVSKNGNDLVLKFAGNFQGNPFDATITLVPDGSDKCKVTFDVNAGMFTMSGAGVKK